MHIFRTLHICPVAPADTYHSQGTANRCNSHQFRLPCQSPPRLLRKPSRANKCRSLRAVVSCTRCKPYSHLWMVHHHSLDMHSLPPPFPALLLHSSQLHCHRRHASRCEHYHPQPGAGCEAARFGGLVDRVSVVGVKPNGAYCGCWLSHEPSLLVGTHISPTVAPLTRAPPEPTGPGSPNRLQPMQLPADSRRAQVRCRQRWLGTRLWRSRCIRPWRVQSRTVLLPSLRCGACRLRSWSWSLSSYLESPAPRECGAGYGVEVGD